jgi:hypothetical protein
MIFVYLIDHLIKGILFLKSSVMNRFNLILNIGTVLVFGILLITTSCKKEDTDDSNPVNNPPVLSFITGSEYVSSNVTMEVSSPFKVGVIGSKNPNTNIDIATFRVTRMFNGMDEIVYENNNVAESYLSWESNEMTNEIAGEEKWVFSITDFTGMSKELSFIITTLEQGTLSPTLIFTQGNDYVSSDTTLFVGSEFLAGINAFASQSTNENLQTFIIKRTFNNNTIIVFEASNINSASYAWQDTLYANSSTGDELWNFSVIDIAGSVTERSFVISTTTQSPYTPQFAPTYLTVQQGGVDYLDFYITCTTDDWEMVKIVVTYPGGLGSEEYIGSGFITPEGTPFTFGNYFAHLGGTWTFSILGYIRSGPHTGESFTAVTTVTVFSN